MAHIKKSNGIPVILSYQTGRLSCKYNDYAMEFLGNMKNVDKDAYCYCGLVKKSRVMRVMIL